MKELKCGCKKSRTSTVYCHTHATQQLENAARNREDNPGGDYFQRSIINDLSQQQRKEEGEEE